MGEVKHALKHDVTREQAKQAIGTALDVYCRKFPQFSPKTTWHGDWRAETSFKVKGMALVAKCEIKDKHIDMSMDVPLLLRPFRSQALGVIETEIKKWLGRAQAGELREVPKN
jgi:hypothetical protein